MKKFISLVLVLLLTFSIIPVSAEKPVLTGLSEIGEVEVVPGMGYGFTYTDEVRKIGTYEKNMEERDLKYFLDVFSDDNLICVDSDIKEEITYTSPDWPEEGTFEFYAKGEKYFVFNFNREKVLVSVAAIDVYYQGWFEFKDNKIFDELMEYLDEIQKRNEKDDDQMGTEPDDSDKDSEEDRFDNQIEISDFKIEYDGIVSNLKGFEFNWGVCSYIREGETEPVYVCYYGAKNEPDYKAFPISEIIEENNTVVLSDMKRFVLVKDGVIDGVEFDNKMTLPHWYRIQVDVADDMTAEKLVISYKNILYNNSDWIIETINMDEYTEFGNLPAKLFSKANKVTDENKITEEPKQEENKTEEKIESDKVTEKEPPEKEENKEQEQEKDEPQKTEEEKEEVESESEVVAEDFIDVPEGHWAYEYVKEFSKRKIVLGYGNGYFGAEDSVTYEHFGLLLDRMFDYKAENTENKTAIREYIIVSLVKALKLDVTNVDENIIEETFTDCYLVKPENRKYIAKAIEKGLVVGYEGRLSPKNRLTRAETVTLLARAEKL